MTIPERAHYPESLLNAARKNSNKHGGPLTVAQVVGLSAKYGPNTVITEKKNPCYMILLQSLLHPFNVLLCIIAISSCVATISNKNEEPDYSTTIIISVMILISTSLRFYQEWKSEGAVNGLLKLITKTVTVLRYDVIEQTALEMSIPSEELVPGDWVVLRPGEVVPADGIVLASKVFFVSQAPLTGEAIPVEKYSMNKDRSVEEISYQEKVDSRNFDVEKPRAPYKPVSKYKRFFMVIFGLRVSPESQLDRKGYLLTEDLSSTDHVFMGCQVITGMATIRVTRIGHDALLGRMAEALSKAQTENAFQKGVKRISWIFFFTMAIMVPPIFLICGFTKPGENDEDRWMKAFLFSLSVAVGLTPEMLPMIVNANLAKGSIALSKKYTIVKKMDAIINLGAVDVLCTDKTGTLTKSVVQLSSHVDPYGNMSYTPLQIAFLNSYFQSVLQNPLDSAIVSFYDKVISPSTGIPLNDDESDVSVQRKTCLLSDATIFATRFSRVDEVPFDFIRRRISVVLKESVDGDEKVFMACKGAVEEILSVCDKTLIENSHTETKDVFPSANCHVPLDRKMQRSLMSLYAKYTDNGERVLAVAYKALPPSTRSVQETDERAMIFVGFICFVDPPKPTSKSAINDLRKHHVEVKILTGDAPNICASICKQIDLPVKTILTGNDVKQAMENGSLSRMVEKGTIFAKLTPLQKALVVQTLRNQNHVVGFLGDGINDAPALKEADVGISVDNGVDICRESADVILLDKDLSVVVDGIRIGRETYGNTIKYIAMAVSSNFGNVFSVLVAASWLPFEPMTSLQILTQNLLYDISQIAIPWDSVDEEFLRVPHHWKMKSILRFMLWMGPWSSVFDIATFVFMYTEYPGDDSKTVKQFQTTWFTVGLLTQTLIVHIIRTPRIPLFQSRASLSVTAMTFLIMGIGLSLPYIPKVSENLNFSNTLPSKIYYFLVGVLVSYCIAASFAKLIYVKIFKEWF